MLSVELFDRAIQEAKPLGLNGVKLTGGEPLLHPRLLDLLEIIRRENLSLSIETNGLLCTSEIAESIAKSHSRFVSVSIDGSDAETHEWIRGVPGSFEKAKQAVKNLAEASTPPQVIMTLMHRNKDQAEEVIHLAEELGASSVKFNIMQPTQRAENLFDTGEALSIEQFVKLQEYFEEKMVPETPLKLLFGSPLAFHPLSFVFDDINPVGRCNICNIIGVLSSGQYALCGIGVSIPELVFGQVGKDRLEDVWANNGILNDLRAGLPGRLCGICERCSMKDLCLGHCVAQNYYGAGNIWNPYWFCEQAEKKGMFPKTRIMM
jgi:SynChlorMet cassette radical SAM/SPASM protein ScmF